MTVHELANRALTRGVFPRRPCEVCGVSKAHMHHDNYLHPLAIRWLCPTHHRQWHTKFKAENRHAMNGVWVPLDEETFARLREATARDDRQQAQVLQRGLRYYLERSEDGKERFA